MSISSLKEHHSLGFLWLLLAVILILIATFARYYLPAGVGDTSSYIASYNHFNQISFSSAPAFHFIINILISMGLGNWSLFFTYAALSVFPAIFIIKKTKSKKLEV